MTTASGVGRTGTDTSAKGLQMETNAIESHSIWLLVWSVSEN